MQELPCIYHFKFFLFRFSDYFYSLLFAYFKRHFAEAEFLYFATAGHGKLLDKEHVTGNFISGNVVFAEIAHIFGGQFTAVFENNECTHIFAVFG